MTRRKISQAEARRLRKRVQELEQRDAGRSARYTQDWPGGVNIDSMQSDVTCARSIDVARACGRYVVVTTDGQKLKFFAVLP